MVARRSTVRRSLALLAILASAGAASAATQTITLRSGQVSGVPGSPGQFDDIVTYGAITAGPGPLSASPFTAADFNNTVSSQATVCTPVGPWIPSLPADPLARWISTGVFSSSSFGNSASTLYRVPFNVVLSGITTATMSISWSSDDSLGDQVFGGANPFGAYLRDPSGNVTALPLVSGGNFTLQSQALGMNILSAINTGLNELFLYQRDQGAGVSGLIFSTTIDVANVPAPTAGAVLGLAGLAAARRRRG